MHSERQEAESYFHLETAWVGDSDTCVNPVLRIWHNQLNSQLDR